MSTNPPTQVGISTYAANMFNTTNQEKCAKKLSERMPALYHMYTNLYSHDLKIWFPDDRGVQQFFKQKDGHIQGGPLSGTFSAITIKPMIEEIKKRMEAKHHLIWERHRTDKSKGNGHSCFQKFDPKGLVEEFTWFPPVEIALDFFELCEKVGPAYSFTLNKSNNKI